MAPTTSQFVEHVTPPLGRLDPQGQLKLYLARRSMDTGGRLDFMLRPLRWEDGRPLSALDLVQTATLVRVPEIASPDRHRTDLVASCRAIGDSIVSFQFRTMYSQRVRDALLMPVPAHALPPRPDWVRLQTAPFTTQPASCGPYRIARSDGRQMLLVRNDAAGFPPAWIDSVEIGVYEPDAALAAYTNGALDVIVDFPAAQLPAARRRPSRVVALVGSSYLFMGWNLRDTRFADPVVRRAAARSVDVAKLGRDASFGQADPSRGPLTALQGFADTTQIFAFDPPRAVRELEAAGWRDSDRDGIRDRRGAKLAFYILVPQNEPQRVAAAAAVAADLRRVGIGAEVRPLPLDELLERLHAGVFEAFVGQWFLSGGLDLDPYWRSDAVEQMNFGHYSSSIADSLLTQMSHEKLAEDREMVLNAFQKRVYADQPYLFLYQNPHFLVLSTSVQGAEPNVVSPFWNLPEWWLANPAGGRHIAAGGTRRR
jgi:peptide/nickel transport system substrate-binding protein